MRATSSELTIWRQRISDRERDNRHRGSIELEVFGALEAERWHAIDYEARVREMAADRREMPSVEGLAIAHRYARMAQRRKVFGA